jgi:hypothetical protein
LLRGVGCAGCWVCECYEGNNVSCRDASAATAATSAATGQVYFGTYRFELWLR